MPFTWSDDAWNDYVWWQSQDRKTLKRINLLLKDIQRNRYEGLGKPEPLEFERSGWWSRRIDQKNRLVYRVLDNGFIDIASCKSQFFSGKKALQAQGPAGRVLCPVTSKR